MTILVTGATGFIGGATAAQLLLAHPDCHVIFLVRAESADHAAARLRQSVSRFIDAAQLDQHWPRCVLLRGDLMAPVALDDPRLDDVTHVLHLAANTSLRSRHGVRRTNREGTLHLARRMARAPRLERFVYVSTAYICGASPPSVVHEDEYPRDGVEHLAEYTRSKAECESLLESYGLPLIIARPSVVVGHTKLGCLPSASIFWYYRTLDLLRRGAVPLDRRKDIIPVDYAADALLHLLFKRDLSCRRYHISAGAIASVSWREIGAAFDRWHGERPENAHRLVEFATIVRERERLRELLGPGDEDRLLQVMEAFFRFSTSGAEVFDNQRLLDEGLPSPPRFTDYLDRCITLPPGRSVYEQMRDDL